MSNQNEITNNNSHWGERDVRRTSKFLSLLLRHRPETIGLELDRHGWADIDDLIQRARANGDRMDRELVEVVVGTNAKQRFSISADGQRIRANQGHSIDVDLEFNAVEPPGELFQGTATRFLEPIMDQGLTKQSRQHVHLAADRATAVNVGSRHRKPVVLVVDAAGMHAAGHEFFRSANGVWLTDVVPSTFLAESS